MNQTVRHRAPWGVLAVLSGNLLIDTIEVSSFFMLLPQLAHELGLDTVELVLLAVAFPLGFAAGIPLAGRVAHAVGARVIFIAALLLFATASLVSGFGEVWWLIALTRVAKGLSAGLTTPLGNEMIARVFGDRAQRDQAVKLYSFIGGWGFLAGLLITAPLVAVSWRVAITWTGPIALALVLMAVMLLPDERPASAVQAQPTRTAAPVLAVAAIPALVMPQGVATVVVALIALGILAMAVMTLRKSLDTLQGRKFTQNAVTAGLFNGGFLVFLASSQLRLQDQGTGPVAAALLLSPVALGMALTSSLTQKLIVRLPLERLVLSATSTMAAAFLAVIALPGAPVPVVLQSVLVGLAFVLGFVPLNARAMESVPEEFRPTAMSTYQTFVQCGAVLSLLSMTGAALTSTPTEAGVASSETALAVISVALLVLGLLGVRNLQDQR